VVSWNKMSMHTANAELIHDMAMRREIFPKDTAGYKILQMFGRNVLTTEGQLWRMHRKVTAASFNEKNAAHTFGEAIRQTKGMVAKWLGPDGKGNKTITTIEHDTMTLALNIIGAIGFGLRLLWPGQTMPDDVDPRLAKYGSLNPPAGHSLTFPQALELTLQKIFAILLVPWPVLKVLPFQWAKIASEAKDEYLAYMDEFLQDKIAEVRQGEHIKEGMDIMGQLVRSKYGKGGDDGGNLSDSDIIGNAFIMIVAGHETTANTLHFILLELATNPAAQRALQSDIDSIFEKGSDPSTWNYESSINAMLASRLGATMNEILRLVPAVVGIPKEVSPVHGDQIVTIDGEKHLLPAGLKIILSSVGAQRNERYWPTRPSKIEPGKPHDLDDFDPERWYRTSDASNTNTEEVKGADTEDYGGFQGPDTSASLFRPVRGSFIAFSDGPRACLGRRIAQVEMLAAMATIFQTHSLELAVDEWASDDEVARMSIEDKKRVYRLAQDKSRATIPKATSLLTLGFHGKYTVPVRLVKRGEERFVHVVDG
jgi:cytochrome P450